MSQIRYLIPFAIIFSLNFLSASSANAQIQCLRFITTDCTGRFGDISAANACECGGFDGTTQSYLWDGVCYLAGTGTTATCDLYDNSSCSGSPTVSSQTDVCSCTPGLDQSVQWSTQPCFVAPRRCIRYSGAGCTGRFNELGTASACECGGADGTFQSYNWEGMCYEGGSTDIATCNVYDNTDCSGTPIASSETNVCSCTPGPNQSVQWSTQSCIPGAVLPVELTSFSAVIVANGVRLEWSTASETNNSGFQVEQIEVDDSATEIGFVNGHGNTTLPQSYSYLVEGLLPGRHVFRLKQIDFDGAFEYSDLVEAVVEVPGEYLIEPAYPNPFNPTTALHFAVARDQEVQVALFDASGRQISVLFAGTARANETQRIDIDAGDLPSGSYVVRIAGADFAESETITLIK